MSKNRTPANTDNRTRTRLFVDYDLEYDHAVTATPEQHHYLRKVMRRIDGEMVTLFNGRHGEWLARIAYHGKARCMMIIEQRLQPQRQPPDILLICSSKSISDEYRAHVHRAWHIAYVPGAH